MQRLKFRACVRAVFLSHSSAWQRRCDEGPTRSDQHLLQVRIHENHTVGITAVMRLDMHNMQQCVSVELDVCAGWCACLVSLL